MTNCFAGIVGSDVNRIATWTSLPSSAATVMGPPTSRGLNSLNCSPYVPCSPIRQNGRLGHSGGPPNTNVLASVPFGEPEGAAAEGVAVGLPLGVADGVGLPPPDPHALRMSATRVAPTAALRIVRMGPPCAGQARSRATCASPGAGSITVSAQSAG